MTPEFKDKKVNKFLINNGECYSIKTQFENSVSSPYQKVVFAVEVKDLSFNELKDINPELKMETTKNTILKVTENCIVTTSADYYQSKEEFLKYYEETTERIDEFIRAYQEERKSRLENKKTHTPKRRR